MNIMWFGQSPRYNSGMGRVGREVAKQLSKYHDLYFYSQSESGGPPRDYKGFKLYGNPVQDPTGTQMLPYRLQQVDPDLFISNLNYQQLSSLSQVFNSMYMNSGNEIPLIFYTAIESAEIPPSLYQDLFADHLNDMYYIPFNEPQYEMMRENKELKPHIPTWIPHGIDHSTFEPKDKTRAKQLLKQRGVDTDDFIFLFVGENWRRKRIDKLVHAFSILKHEKGVGDTRLILHASAGPSRGDDFFAGWEIASGPGTGPDPMLDVYNLNLGTDVHISKRHSAEFIPDEQLALMYSGADAHVLPTMGEGFGMTLLEAMACGTPNIVTSLPETRWLCEDSALYVEPEGEELMRKGEVLKTPSAQDMAEKMKKIYEMDEEKRIKMIEEGKKKAKDFSWKRTGKEFIKLIDEEL